MSGVDGAIEEWARARRAAGGAERAEDAASRARLLAGRGELPTRGSPARRKWCEATSAAKRVLERRRRSGLSDSQWQELTAQIRSLRAEASALEGAMLGEVEEEMDEDAALMGTVQ